MDNNSIENYKRLEARYDAKRAKYEAQTAYYEHLLVGSRLRPCHYYPVTIEHDGIRWTCTYLGSDAAVGYGESPQEAMNAFDKMWQGVANELDGTDSLDG